MRESMTQEATPVFVERTGTSKGGPQLLVGGVLQVCADIVVRLCQHCGGHVTVEWVLIL